MRTKQGTFVLVHRYFWMGQSGSGSSEVLEFALQVVRTYHGGQRVCLALMNLPVQTFGLRLLSTGLRQIGTRKSHGAYMRALAQIVSCGKFGRCRCIERFEYGSRGQSSSPDLRPRARCPPTLPILNGTRGYSRRGKVMEAHTGFLRTTALRASGFSRSRPVPLTFKKLRVSVRMLAPSSIFVERGKRRARQPDWWTPTESPPACFTTCAGLV